MSQIYIVFFKIFVCIALGFVLNKTRVIDRRTEKTLSDILLKAVFPFTIISSSQYVYSVAAVKGIIAVAVFAAVYYALSLFLMCKGLRLTKIGDDEQRIMSTSAVFANTGFIGFPLMQALFGKYGLLLAAVFNLLYNVFFYTAGVIILSKKPFRPIDLCRSAVSLSSIIALILFVIPWRMPVFIQDTISLVGNMTVPLSLIVIGSMLSSINPKKLFTDSKSYVTVVIRMVIIPAVVFIFLILVSRHFEILPVTKYTMLLMSALPCGSMNVIYAEQYDTAPQFATRTVALSMIFMLFTMLFWSWLASLLF